MNGDNNRILSSDCRYSCQTDCLRADQIDLENWWEIDDFKDSSTTEETCITSATTIAQQTILLLTLKLSVSLSPPHPYIHFSCSDYMHSVKTIKWKNNAILAKYYL